MAQKKETTTVQNPCFLAASDYPVLMWRQQAGMYRAYDNPARIVHVGLAGMADSAMIVPVKITQEMVGQTFGMAVQVEFKTEAGRQSEKQKKWQQAVIQAGGRYELVSSVEQFKQLVESLISPAG